MIPLDQGGGGWGTKTGVQDKNVRSTRVTGSSTPSLLAKDDEFGVHEVLRFAQDDNLWFGALGFPPFKKMEVCHSQTKIGVKGSGQECPLHTRTTCRFRLSDRDNRGVR